MPDLSNPQGLNPQQMGTAAGGSPSPADTVKAAQAAPGTLQTGATTGTTAPGQGVAPIATTFQAKTAANPPLISPTANPNVLSSSDATAYTNGVRGQLDTQQTDLNKRSADLQGTIQQRAQAAFDASKKTIETNLQPEKENMASSERSADLTATAANVKTGVAGTDYGKDVIGELTDKHLQEQNIFNQKEQKLLSDAWDSALRGSIGEVAQAQKELSDLGTQRDKAAQDYYKNQTDALNLEKLSTGAADTTINRMLTGGFTPNETQLSLLDQKYGLDPGTSQTLYSAAVAAKKLTDTKEQTDAVDAAKKLTDYLDSRPTGEPVQIGNNTYYGTGKAGLKTGVEIDKTTGQGLAYSYDPTTGRTTTTPMGTVGFNDPNWTIKENPIDHSLWRVSAVNGEMQKLGATNSLPMSPGSAQQTNAAIFPDGQKGPALPGHEANAGQCGAAWNFWAGGALLGTNGDTLAGKIQALSKFPTVAPADIQSHDTVIMRGGTSGHIFAVGDVHIDPQTGKQVFSCTESNFVPPGQGLLSNTRFMSADDPSIVSIKRVPLPNLPPSGSDSLITMAASGSQNGWATGNGATDNKPLTASEISARGLDPTDPRNANLTQADLPAAMKRQTDEGGTTVPGVIGSSEIKSDAPGYTTSPVKGAGGLTQAAIDQAATQFAITGTMPPIGRGSTGAALQKSNAIQARAGELGLGTTITANKAQMTALTSSLTEQTKYQNDTERAVKNAEDGFNQLISTFKNAGINTSNSRIANQWVNDYKRNLSGGDINAFDAGLTEVANEYTQVFSRGGSVSDTVRKKSDAILSGNISFKDLEAVQKELQAQGKIVIEGAKRQVGQIQDQMNNILNPKNETSTPQTFAVSAPDGKTYTFKDQKSLDTFKKSANIQ